MFNNDLDIIIKERMKRFQILLENGKLQFHKYQEDGVEWCLRRELGFGINGGIVADEMGLGKTITMIGLLFVNIKKKTLIVVPPILMEQWYNQILKITGHKALIYHGSVKKNIDSGLDKQSLEKACIVITSFNIMAISKKNNKLNTLHKIKWKRLIIDEAHHLRNKNTTRFLGCFNIRSDFRWLLTGTPIQNKKSDFIHLCYILCPLTMKNKDIDKTEVVKTIIECNLLKRTKSMIGLELENCQLNNLKVDWFNKEEKQFAKEIHSLIKVSNVNEQSLTKFSKQIGASLNSKNSKLIAILRAKQSCIMPSLMKKTVEWLVDTNKINNHYLHPISSENNCSSKLGKVLEVLLDRKENKRGKLVFCQFREEMNFLCKSLIDNGLTSMIIDGRCVGKNRILLLKKSVDVLILQIQTGCEGLNLQEFYSEVYFVSPHWNPSIEDQAIARCHRMGQKHKVEVFTFEMNGFDLENKTISLETHIKFIQETKRSLRF